MFHIKTYLRKKIRRYIQEIIYDTVYERNYKYVGMFHKVKYGQYYKDLKEHLTEEQFKKFFPTEKHIRDSYNRISIPTRKTKNAMAYDFTPPFDFSLAPNEHINIPTGIKFGCNDGWGLLLAVRSGCAKHRIQFDDILPVIDGDYYNCPSNEGDIIIHMTNDNKEDKTIFFGLNTSFIQGIITPYGTAIGDDEHLLPTRHGGYGSTNK